MLSGLPSSAASRGPEQTVAEPADLLQQFLKGNSRQRQRLWKAMPAKTPALSEAIWELLESQSRQADDWAIGSLLRLLAEDPDQLAKLDIRDKIPTWDDINPFPSWEDITAPFDNIDFNPFD